MPPKSPLIASISNSLSDFIATHTDILSVFVSWNLRVLDFLCFVQCISNENPHVLPPCEKSISRTVYLPSVLKEAYGIWDECKCTCFQTVLCFHLHSAPEDILLVTLLIRLHS